MLLLRIGLPPGKRKGWVGVLRNSSSVDDIVYLLLDIVNVWAIAPMTIRRCM